jgi:hypothetical protein
MDKMAPVAAWWLQMLTWLLLLAPLELVIAPSSGTDIETAPCGHCPADWRRISFTGAPAAGNDSLCNLVSTCAAQVAECDWTLPPDEVFASCKNLTDEKLPQQTERHFKGAVTGLDAVAFYIQEQLPRQHKRGPFVLFIAPTFSGDYWNWACYYVFSYLASQGIATFTATIPDSADAARDSWTHLPSRGPRPYQYDCSSLGICDNSSRFLHDRHILDVMRYAESLGYDPDQSVWWGYSEGGVMLSAHLNSIYYINTYNRTGAGTAGARARPAGSPKAIVLEATGSQYCYAFTPEDMQTQLSNSSYWRGCPAQSWPLRNCCPANLTEQYFFEDPARYEQHPPTLLIQSEGDLSSDPNGSSFYHAAMRQHSARSAIATWPGSAHGITPFAFGFAASYIQSALGLEPVAVDLPRMGSDEPPLSTLQQ